MTTSSQKFCPSFAKDAEFEGDLRGYFEYRDLGISDATQGQFHAAVSRVRVGKKEVSIFEQPVYTVPRFITPYLGCYQ